MQTSKAPNPNIAKLTDQDDDLLNQLRAVAQLKRWPGNWSNRGAAIRASMDRLITLLPAEEREMLTVPENEHETTPA
jgi:hypothetical protein